MASIRLKLTIPSARALYRAYMPFVRNGGLFVPTDRTCGLGDDVSITLNLVGAKEPIPVSGKIVWVTPKRAQGKRTAGIGVQFNDNSRCRADMEARLTGLAECNEPTHTL